MNSNADRTSRVTLTILGLWLGAMAYFSFVVAPIAFSVLNAPRLAGDIVSRNLAVTEIVGIALGSILIAMKIRQITAGPRSVRSDLFILSIMTSLMVVSKFLVSARLHQIRVEYGERLASLPVTDPIRSTFNNLHQVSVWLMGLTMICALILIVRMTRR